MRKLASWRSNIGVELELKEPAVYVWATFRLEELEAYIWKMTITATSSALPASQRQASVRAGDLLVSSI